MRTKHSVSFLDYKVSTDVWTWCSGSTLISGIVVLNDFARARNLHILGKERREELS
jgi:hypothetical protein